MPKVFDLNPLEDDVMTPGQFFERYRRGHRNLDGERKLLLAVLEDGIACFAGEGTFHSWWGDHGKRRGSLQTDAWDWVRAPDNDSSPFTFSECCRGLGIEPAWMRTGLLRWWENKKRAPVPRRAPAPGELRSVIQAA